VQGLRYKSAECKGNLRQKKEETDKRKEETKKNTKRKPEKVGQ
jgi:hypothetical protein